VRRILKNASEVPRQKRRCNERKKRGDDLHLSGITVGSRGALKNGGEPVYIEKTTKEKEKKRECET